MATANKAVDPAGYSSRAQKVLILGGDNTTPASAINPIPISSEGDNAIQLDDYTTTNVTYVGYAAIASTTSASVWKIKKLDETTGLSLTYADGDEAFDNVWDDRVGLSYS